MKVLSNKGKSQVDIYIFRISLLSILQGISRQNIGVFKDIVMGFPLLIPIMYESIKRPLYHTLVASFQYLFITSWFVEIQHSSTILSLLNKHPHLLSRFIMCFHFLTELQYFAQNYSQVYIVNWCFTQQWSNIPFKGIVQQWYRI